MVERVEKIVNGEVVKWAARYAHAGEQLFQCYPAGTTTNPQRLHNLDEVAAYLIANHRSLVRMEPDRAMTADNIFIDGVALEALFAQANEPE